MDTNNAMVVAAAKGYREGLFAGFRIQILPMIIVAGAQSGLGAP